MTLVLVARVFPVRMRDLGFSPALTSLREDKTAGKVFNEEGPNLTVVKPVLRYVPAAGRVREVMVQKG